jgi:hypothetical protein
MILADMIRQRAAAEAWERNRQSHCRLCGLSSYREDRHVLKTGICRRCRDRLIREEFDCAD